MILRRFGWLVFLPILGVSSSHADDTRVLRDGGVGPVEIGTGLQEVNAALQERFQLPAEKDDRACFYVKSNHHPHVAFMIPDGRLTCIEVDAGHVFVKGSFPVGDSKIHGLRVHGSKVKVEPGKCTGREGHD
jgi:hypothetical protein